MRTKRHTGGHRMEYKVEAYDCHGKLLSIDEASKIFAQDTKQEKESA